MSNPISPTFEKEENQSKMKSSLDYTPTLEKEDERSPMKSTVDNTPVTEKELEEEHQCGVKSTVDNSLAWRLFHGINFLFGGLFFIAGSCMYFPKFNPTQNPYGYIWGGWLFTVGSLNFFIADILEWNHVR
jgi:hypothetical protein